MLGGWWRVGVRRRGGGGLILDGTSVEGDRDIVLRTVETMMEISV